MAATILNISHFHVDKQPTDFLCNHLFVVVYINRLVIEMIERAIKDPKVVISDPTSMKCIYLAHQIWIYSSTKE